MASQGLFVDRTLQLSQRGFYLIASLKCKPLLLEFQIGGLPGVKSEPQITFSCRHAPPRYLALPPRLRRMTRWRVCPSHAAPAPAYIITPLIRVMGYHNRRGGTTAALNKFILLYKRMSANC